MTTAVFTFRKKEIVAFTVEGHSGYAEEGSDIVCASVSSAAWMTVNGLESVLGLSPDYEDGDGYLSCRVSDSEAASAQTLLQSLKEFLCKLSIEYGDYLTVKEVHETC